MMESSAIENEHFVDVSHLPDETKNRPHGGENQSDADETERRVAERIVSKKPPSAEPGEVLIDVGVQPTQPDQYCLPEDGSGLSLVSNPCSPPIDDPSDASCPPHRSIHRTENPREGTGGTRGAKDLASTTSESDPPSMTLTRTTSRRKEVIWMKMDPLPTCHLKRSKPRAKRWKRKRWKSPAMITRRRPCQHYQQAAGN